jgi:hypothetical protein
MTEQKLKYRRTSLLVAALIYILGVIILTTWSFFRHQKGHLQQLYSHLAGTVSAVHEMLDDDITALLSPGAEQTDLYAKRKKQLRNIAIHGNLILLGAIDLGDFSNSFAISDNDTDLPPDLSFLHPAPGQTIRRGNPILKSLPHPGLGELNTALMTEKNSTILYFSAYDTQKHMAMHPGDAISAVVSGIALILLALPLVIITRKTERVLTLETEALNTRLKQDVAQQKNREKELKEAISDLERFNAVSAGRESRVIELKTEVNELLQQMNLEKRYNIEQTD